MKILHVNYHENRGGAGRAVWRLHRLFLEQGLDSHLLAAEKHSADARTYQAFGPSELKKIHLMQRIEANLNRIVSRRLYPFPRSYNMLRTSLNEAVVRLNPDLVILHWINGSMASVEQLPQLGVPTVWMLHDSWIYCGAEHYLPFDDRRFETGYDDAFDPDAAVFRRKRRAWNDWNIPLVASSSWLESQCRRSLLFREHTVFRGALPFPGKVFYPERERTAVRRIFGFPPGKKILLLGTLDRSYGVIKGLDLFQKALMEMDPVLADNTACVLCGGEVPLDLPLPVYFAGNITDDNLLRALYCAADAVVCPSRREAFGQIAVEASACGTPVAAFSGTGHDSSIVHLETGYLARMGNYHDLARGIGFVLNAGPRLGDAARSFVSEKYDPVKIARDWRNIAERVLERDF
ncbi:MAG: glycosyltransferase [Lentisphaeria bacterium]|nr:glycosyltransferase [Lentisphaeria bacterium]